MKSEKSSAKTSKPASAKPAVKPAAKSSPKIPAILLEGDAPVPPPVSGPGQRYVLGPTPPAAVSSRELSGELPEAYGTQKLLLTARDPHWLYAHWDLTREQQKKYNSLSTDGHLVVRVYQDVIGGKPVCEQHVHPESKNWFIHVGRAGTKFLAELGCYGRDGRWKTISTSGATLTPPDTMSDDTSARFETMPIDVPLEQLLSLVKAAVRENVPLIEALQQLRASGYRGLPDAPEIAARRWTPAQERALAEVVTMDAVRRVWIGSLEITELVRRQLLQQISSAGVAQFSQAGLWSGAVTSVTSPFGGVPGRKGFWFNVNAELIIYGATEPDAQVTIGGRAIKLRSDGSFSFRFALPDGRYDLPAIATSADGEDSRTAALQFSRSTEYRGDVGRHPQDPKLKTPHARNVA